MNIKCLVLAVVMVMKLIGATTTLATEDAFAGRKRDYNQATSQANACGSSELRFNVGCQNSDREVQGKDNAGNSNLTESYEVLPGGRDNGEVEAVQSPEEPGFLTVLEPGTTFDPSRSPFGSTS